MEYTSLQKESNRFGERNDCTVKAYAVVANVSYEEARKEMAKEGRVFRKGLKSDFYAYNNRMLRRLRANGFEVEFVGCKSKTVRTLGRNIKSKDSFLIFTKGHVLAAKEGKIIDWTEGRCHRILTVWKVSK